jgi:DNA anti-recombination protein RmuC
MEYVIAGLAGLAVVLLLVILLRRGRGGETQRELIELCAVASQQSEQLVSLRDLLVKQLGEQEKSVIERLGKDQLELINSLQEHFGKVQKEVEGVKGKAEELARQATVIGELRELLRSPKQRGIIGEESCEIVLTDTLPDEYWTRQFRLQGVGIVDYAVKLGDRFVPIDAKFPDDSFQRLRRAENTGESERKKARRDFVKTVQEKIDQVAKYVRPDLKTMEFGIVYLPVEGIYFEASQRRYPDDPEDDLLAYARRKKVVMTSPSLLFAYLRTVYLGLQSLKIEKKAEEIMCGLSALRSAFNEVRVPLIKLGNQLSDAWNNFNKTSRAYSEAELLLGRLAAEGVGSELLPGEESGVPPGGEEKS